MALTLPYLENELTMKRMKNRRAPAAMNMRMVIDLKLLPSMAWFPHVVELLPAILISFLYSLDCRQRFTFGRGNRKEESWKA